MICSVVGENQTDEKLSWADDAYKTLGNAFSTTAYIANNWAEIIFYTGNEEVIMFWKTVAALVVFGCMFSLWRLARPIALPSLESMKKRFLGVGDECKILKEDKATETDDYGSLSTEDDDGTSSSSQSSDFDVHDHDKRCNRKHKAHKYLSLASKTKRLSPVVQIDKIMGTAESINSGTYMLRPRTNTTPHESPVKKSQSNK